MPQPPLLLHVFATFVPGGPQVRTCRLLNALGSQYRHRVMAIDGRLDAMELFDSDLDVEPLEPNRGRFGPAYPLYLARVLRGIRPQLLLTYNWGSMDAVIGNRFLKVAPHIHTEDGFGPDEAHQQKRRRVWTRRLLLRSSKALVAPSRNLMRIMEDVWKLPPSRLQFIPNGIDTQKFCPGPSEEAWRRSRSIEEDAIVVGTVAHLRPEKNLGRLLGCVAKARQKANVHLMVVGDGTQRASLEQLTKSLDLGGAVHFLGAQNETVPLYRTMDVFALSSDTEQMPVSLIEAMACGLPAFSTDVGDVSRVLSEANRKFVTPVEEESALVDSLSRLASDSTLRRELGQENRRRVLQEYDEALMVNRYQALFEAHRRSV